MSQTKVHLEPLVDKASTSALHCCCIAPIQKAHHLKKITEEWERGAMRIGVGKTHCGGRGVACVCVCVCDECVCVMRPHRPWSRLAV